MPAEDAGPLDLAVRPRWRDLNILCLLIGGRLTNSWIVSLLPLRFLIFTYRRQADPFIDCFVISTEGRTCTRGVPLPHTGHGGEPPASQLATAGNRSARPVPASSPASQLATASNHGARPVPASSSLARSLTPHHKGGCGRAPTTDLVHAERRPTPLLISGSVHPSRDLPHTLFV